MVFNIGWANHWLRSMDTYTFLRWLTLVSATKQCFEQRGHKKLLRGIVQVLHRVCHRLQNLLKPRDKVSPLTVPAMMFSVGDPELRVTFSAVGRGMVWYPQSGLSLIIFHLSPTSLVSAAKRQRGLLPIHT